MSIFLIPFLSGAKSCLGALMAFFSKPPGAYIGIALAGIISLWWYGQHEFNRGAASIVQKQQFQAARLVVHQAQITMNISANFEGLRIVEIAATNHLLDEVPIHVTPAIDFIHPVPCGFVRVFNAGVHDPIPDTACQPDDAASGIALSEVAKASVQNDGAYDICTTQLGAIQEWIRQQQQAAAQR